MRPTPRALAAALLRRSTLPALLALLVLGAAPAAPAADREISLDLGKGTRLEMILVEPGTYAQGSPADEIGRGDDEAEREVTISRAFYVGRAPVTRGQFARFCEATGFRTDAEKGSSGGSGWDGARLAQRKDFTWRSPGFAQTDDHPVCLVTYDDAVAFCAWLSTQARRAVALPTEAQWEYACRGGTRTRFPSGDGDDEGRAAAWCKDDAGDGTRPVGQKQANPWGLVDACGNVHQWCRDWYAPYASGPQSDPEQAQPDPGQDKPRRVLRGGSWNRELKNCRAAARSRNTPGTRNADNGFRVVAAPEATRVSDAGGGPRAEGRDGDAAPAAAAQRDRAREAHDAGRPRTARSGSGDSALSTLVGGVICCGGPLALGAYLAFGRGRSDTPAASLGAASLTRRARGKDLRFTATAADDGFWLAVPGAPRGAVAEYRCAVGGAQQTGKVTIEGEDRQFVYTGGRPSDVVVVALLVASGGAWPTDAGDAHDDGHLGAGGSLASGGHDGLSTPHPRSHDASTSHGSTGEPFGGFPRAY